jgi:predicted homoserine dehydrogenase-like protein
VVAVKTDLKTASVLDGLGQYMTYGLCENRSTAVKENLLPIGVAEGCILKRNISKDEVLTYDDVILHTGRLCDGLRNEQAKVFPAFVPKKQF